MDSQICTIDKNDSDLEETEELETHLEINKELSKDNGKKLSTPNEEWNYIRKMSNVNVINNLILMNSKQPILKSFKKIVGEEIYYTITAFFVFEKSKLKEGILYVTNFRITFIEKDDIINDDDINPDYTNCLFTLIYE